MKKKKIESRNNEINNDSSDNDNDNDPHTTHDKEINDDKKSNKRKKKSTKNEDEQDENLKNNPSTKEGEDEEEDKEEVTEKLKNKTSITTNRKDWLSFLKFWVNESNLFHHEYPKSQHVSFFRLRVKKLAICIYEYLHEYNYYYFSVRDHYATDMSGIEHETVLDGRYYPEEQMIDPASRHNKCCTKVFFPLTGES